MHANYKMEKMNARQEQILKIIVEEYTRHTIPIGSKHITGHFLKRLSSATVRNDMAVLEKLGMLEKTHASSGRIPSLVAYRYYSENIAKNNAVNKNLKKRLKELMAKRYSSIDDVIDTALTLISETTQLPSVLTESNASDTLKRIDLIPITRKTATIIVVTSSGNVSNNMITLDKESQIDDIAVCIRIFNDRLVDTKLSEITERVIQLESVIREQVKEYEYIVQEVIAKIFKNQEIVEPRVFGASNLIIHPEFSDKNRLKELLDLLEDVNVWQQIALNQEKTGKTQITFGKDLGLPEELAFATTNIDVGNQTRQVTVVGPTRMDYAKVQSLLDLIKTEIESEWNEHEVS